MVSNNFFDKSVQYEPGIYITICLLLISIIVKDPQNLQDIDDNLRLKILEKLPTVLVPLMYTSNMKLHVY